MRVTSVITHWPRRYVVVALTFLGCIIAYTDRVNISVAAIAMKDHFGWSQTQKGFVLANLVNPYAADTTRCDVVDRSAGGRAHRYGRW